MVALDRVKAAWSSLEEYFALNASTERAFRGCRGRFKSVSRFSWELVVGLNQPEIKTKVATALDMKMLEEALEARVLGRARSGESLGDC